MKVLNVILSVMILLLSILIAVSSYFLFIKRDQMVKGWEKMATAINVTAAELDKGSGTVHAKDLTVASLSHSNYDNIPPLLAKLNTQAKTLVAERDALAETIRNICNIVEMGNVPPIEDFMRLDRYNSSKDEAIKAVNDFRDRRNTLINNTIQVAKRVNVNLDRNALIKGDIVGAMKALDNRLVTIQNQFDAYKKNVQTIAQTAGAKAPDLSDANYAKSLSETATAVRNLKSRLDNALADVEKGRRDLQNAQNTIKSRDNQIGSLKTTIDGKDSLLKEYRDSMGLQENQEPWKPGSVDARKRVRGKIVEINEQFGFIALDIGKSTVVEQLTNKEALVISPQIDKDMEMVVARNMDSPDVKYIGKIRLSNVESDASIAEVIELAAKQKVQIGDVVYFQNGLTKINEDKE